MTPKDRVKRRILRELVDENVATLRGAAPARLRRRRRWPTALTAAGPLLLPASLALLAVIWASTTGDTQPVSGRAATAARASSPATVKSPVETPGGEAAGSPLEALSALAPGRRFPRPAIIDRSVLPLGVRCVVLDPGHGGDDFGTTGPFGLVEKELTLDIALRVAEILTRESFDVILTRTTDEAVPLQRRAAIANQAHGDVMVSIHVNWIPNRATRGVETYCLGATDDPFLTRLAASENRNSGYSLADFRRLLEGIYADVRKDESQKLAEAVQQQLFTSLARRNPGLVDRGVKTAPFLVLVATDMPAILAEVSCLSNEAEAHLLAQPRYRRQIAEALAAGIRDYAVADHAAEPRPDTRKRKGT
jgi:N-acetylmuramoyl-L-alanine amidase